MSLDSTCMFRSRMIALFIRFGPNYWMADMEMDCNSAIQDGWFDVKAFVSASFGWEDDLVQVRTRVN